ncbi:hypothetical protein BKP45_07735 [Anaerobacillus alkalidiazotrophicus]|uniref:Uncharacterized protein n=1 Tax=Anaerobacillus alkalidiazotrophicus TaxID=472963 RepID=A0A1S2M8L9_9BACI|nr:YuzB family protein [Anaerobacillus alkalidiazotrophicus]OIJ20944.1 hypothetical protein BKP45_07735 [Anaerobacillus alkalidiazotrophicus]
MRPIIEFCATNLASGTQRALEVLEKDPDLDVIEYGCLSFCGKCAASPFALVNGEVITAETSEDLVKKIYTFIDENLVF